MGVTRTFRLLTGAVAGALVLGVVGTTAAEAKPPVTPGGVTGLAATVTPGAGSYEVASSWNAATNAIKYRVTLKMGATTLSTDTVTATSWNVTVSTAPGSASLSVQPLAAKKSGPTATISVSLADVTAPTGTYSSSWDNTTGVATITQDSLSDNAGAANVTRKVDWNDGSAPQDWTAATPITHTYPRTLHGYSPTVTLQDAAHNQAVVNVPVIVMMDTTAPTGTFTATPGTAWATLTPVTLTQTALSDNWSQPGNITRTVDWGDDTAPEKWTTGDTLTHVYTTAGAHVPQVTITDEAHNAAVVPTTAVNVSVDSTAPVVKLTLPKKRLQHSVRAFRTLRGNATDTAGTGVQKVTVKAVEKRGRAWYGYNATTKKWVRAATKAKAFARSRAFSLTTSATHTWTATLVALTKGTLVYRVTATDLVKNTSAPVLHTATLTRR